MHFVLAVLAVACNQRPAGGSVDGGEVFAATCVTCHGSAGKPNQMMIERLGVRDLTSPELRAKITPAYVEQQVRKGSANKLMPAFERALTEEQIKAVAAYVASDEFLSPRDR